MNLSRSFSRFIPLLLLPAALASFAQETGAPPEVPAVESATTDQPADAELLIQQFEQYKQLLADGVLDEADAAAKRVVELTIRLHGPSSSETAKALSNLALVQHRNKQYDAAQQNFAAAIDIIEDVDDRLSSKLVNPLKGLGAAQLEGGRPDLALGTFDRAVHVTHVNDGPHNMDQVELLESVAETNYRLGFLEEAKKAHDRIYALNRRYFEEQPEALIEPLMRRAAWQRRTGHHNDERSTYRAVIRIIEEQSNKFDPRLVEPLMRLGESYYYIDNTQSTPYRQPAVMSGEVYFKRAMNIAENDKSSSWSTLAATKLSLADFYLGKSSISRANVLYAEIWELLSEEDDRLDNRRELLEQPVALRFGPIPDYVGKASIRDTDSVTETLLTGNIDIVFDVTSRGRVTNLQLTDAKPAEFDDLQRFVMREFRSRVYRPKLADGEPVDAIGQTYSHQFFYRKSELESMRENAQPQPAAEATEAAN
jgi:tetratricopeptide (TPR) repeat protein